MMTVLVTLVQNAALLLAMMVVFDLIARPKPGQNQGQYQALAGVILGGLCIGLMLASFQLETGIIFDTRSVLLSLSGLFLGAIPTLLAMAMAAAYRFLLGGLAAWPGVLVILATGGIGILWRHYRPGRLTDISLRELYGFGLVVHVVMLALMLTLPWEIAMRVIGAIGVPVLLVFPVATVALGWLLANRLQREDAAHALAASESRFRSLFEAANVGKSLTLPTGELTVNRAFCDMLGYSPEELRSKTWQELTPPEEIGPINELLAPLMRGEKNAARFEKHYVHKNGTRVPVDCSVTLQRDQDGKPLHFIVAVVDITERKLAEQAIIESEQRYRSLFEHMNAGFVLFEVILDDQGTPADLVILNANQGFAATTGLTLEDAIGKRLTEALPGIGDDAVDWIGTYGKVALSGEPWESEQRSELLGTAYSVAAFQPAPGQCGVTFIDITERAQAEAERQRLLANITRERSVLVSTLEEQRRTEENLRASEARFRQAIMGAPYPIMIHAEDGEVLIINTPWTRLTGYEHSDIPTIADWTRKAYGAQMDVVRTYIDTLFALDGPRAEGEYAIATSSGEERTWDFSSAPIGQLPDGRRMVISMAMDVTERKHAEQELLRMSQFMNDAQEIAHLGSFQYVAADQSTIWSEEEYRIYGLDPEGPSPEYNEMLENCIHPDDAKLLDDTFRAAIQSQGVYELEHRILRPDGSVRWVYDLARPYFNDDGELVRYVGTTLDVTERKEIEADRKKFFLLAESSSEFIGMCDLEMNPIYVNPAGRSMVGLPDMEAACRVKVQDYYFPEDQQFIAEEFFPRVLREGHGEVEIRLRHFQTAEPIWMFYSLFRVLDDAGTPVGWATVSRDITEQKRLRTELITLNKELEAKVEQRTAALEASNTELEAFSYSVSHDLRAPLRHISGYVDLLNNRFGEALPEKAGHYLEEITDSAHQMGALIDDLLQFSRTGRHEMQQTEIDMNALVQEALEKLKVNAEDRDISWTIADLPNVFGDPALLRQVWLNLLDNAIKYTRYTDQARIEVGCTGEAGSREFFVRDNGVGFDMKYSHKLFGVFQRLHSPAEYEGTGIGLANVQRIIHKHGGRVRAEARPDEGATFYFSLPENTTDEGRQSSWN